MVSTRHHKFHWNFLEILQNILENSELLPPKVFTLYRKCTFPSSCVLKLLHTKNEREKKNLLLELITRKVEAGWGESLQWTFTTNNNEIWLQHIFTTHSYDRWMEMMLKISLSVDSNGFWMINKRRNHQRVNFQSISSYHFMKGK